LDRFLATAQADLSRSRLQSLIRDGRVRVNGVPGRASQRLRPGDLVSVEIPAPAGTELAPEARSLDIVFEDEHVIVLNKPAGLVVHPGAGIREGTLVHALLHHAPDVAGVGGSGRPGIVHRLDKDTSGLMVVARTARAYRALVTAIQERRVHRIYHALAWGVPLKDSGVLETGFGRHPRHRTRMAVLPAGARTARTHWRILERLAVASLIELELDTGRTHQIRVHLAHLGHPVVGDLVYGRDAKKQLRGSARERSLQAALVESLRRQALHAFELGFDHPITGAPLRFSRPVPEDFGRALEILRSSAAERKGPIA
jgi:23S rRNA pseudouridine1911/1915/1917 synthase